MDYEDSHDGFTRRYDFGYGQPGDVSVNDFIPLPNFPSDGGALTGLKPDLIVTTDGDTPFYPGVLANIGLYSPNEIAAFTQDPAFDEFKLANPEDAAVLEGFLQSETQAEFERLRRQGGGVPIGNPADPYGLKALGIESGGIPGFFKKLGAGFKDLTGISGGDALKYATMMAIAKLAYDDAKQAREEAKGAKLDIAGVRAVRGADGGVSFRSAAQGGLMSMVDDVDPIATAQRVMTDPEHQRKFEGYLMEYLGQGQGYDRGGIVDDSALNLLRNFVEIPPAQQFRDSLREGRLLYPEVYEDFFRNDALRNISSMYPELPNKSVGEGDITTAGYTAEELTNLGKDAAKYFNMLPNEEVRKFFEYLNTSNNDTLRKRDDELYEVFKVPSLASRPLSKELLEAVDDIKHSINVASMPSPEQIAMHEANVRYAPVGLYSPSLSDDDIARLYEQVQLYAPRDQYTSEFSEEYNPALEATLRHFEKTGQVIGYGGEDRVGSMEFGGGGFDFGGGGGGLNEDELMFNKGGVARYFAGGTDGMADEIPANIENQRPAALSDGEFVIPADVVSHLGNGNSNAGAKRLYEMMDRIRDARTGTTKQGIEIDPNKFMLG